MQQRSIDNPKITIHYNSAAAEILFDDSGVTGVKIKDTVTGEIVSKECAGFFLGIGHTPNTGFLEGQIDIDDHGFITTKNDVETNIPGVFACGDVQDSYYRQAISAAGTGCMAAIRAERFIEDNK